MPAGTDDPQIIIGVTKEEEEEQLNAPLSPKELMYHPEILGGAWLERLKELREYKERHGDCLVPKRYAPNQTLGNWVNKQRQLYRKYQKGESSSMSPERVWVLEEMGFVWGATTSGETFLSVTATNRDKAWFVRFEELKNYAQTTTKTKTTTTTTTHSSAHTGKWPPSSCRLGHWVISQRAEYNRWKMGESPCSMTQERIDALDTIQFPWKNKYEQLWEERIRQLQEYKDLHGDCLVPLRYEANPSLANWVSTQRKNYKLRNERKRSFLTKERVQQLESMGFVWNFWDFEFESKFSPLSHQ
eukprot:CAMPEP_0198286796 /NCGR_PEP_ID=MMETSP1449-20131203/5767_1 /TAXON_ID=420275 /ORGANISM="Attheya septentrionalis, Strain CCMP2084" /LENGTH=300 /DNA_ID=CAMNT_0043984603 /DNA_START=342 /DNA_END=1244 /DNA_ORIENTATION=-